METKRGMYVSGAQKSGIKTDMFVEDVQSRKAKSAYIILNQRDILQPKNR